uniref:Reverse transcriptase domain-containing protein n=1 Tax=Panagrolaimus davidi TaxID=227884 RepID=A0A914PE81_9BILA
MKGKLMIKKSKTKQFKDVTVLSKVSGSDHRMVRATLKLPCKTNRSRPYNHVKPEYDRLELIFTMIEHLRQLPIAETPNEELKQLKRALLSTAKDCARQPILQARLSPLSLSLLERRRLMKHGLTNNRFALKPQDSTMIFIHLKPVPTLREPNVMINRITADELTAAAQHMKGNTAPGADNIPSKAVKSTISTFAGRLADAFYGLLEEDNMPPELLHAKTILLYKKGNRLDIGNYRPISLLPVLYKILTRVITDRVSTAAENAHALPPEQAGFRRTYSTVDHIHSLNQLFEKSREFNMPLYVSLHGTVIIGSRHLHSITSNFCIFTVHKTKFYQFLEK